MRGRIFCGLAEGCRVKRRGSRMCGGKDEKTEREFHVVTNWPGCLLARKDSCSASFVACSTLPP